MNILKHQLLGGGVPQIFLFIFTPKIWGRCSPILTGMFFFQGWFNHQLSTHNSCLKWLEAVGILRPKIGDISLKEPWGFNMLLHRVHPTFVSWNPFRDRQLRGLNAVSTAAKHVETASIGSTECIQWFLFGGGITTNSFNRISTDFFQTRETYETHGIILVQV